jgi:hypothetical protein
MIALAPPTLRVVLGARRVVGLDVAALRVYGAVHIVDADDLRFRSWEVERLFREIYHQPLPPEDAATLSQRTGGWAAGLAMFHLLTEGRPPAQRRRARWSTPPAARPSWRGWSSAGCSPPLPTTATSSARRPRSARRWTCPRRPVRRAC